MKEELKVQRQEDMPNKRSVILPTIEEELSFQADSSRKKKLDTIQFEKQDVIRRLDPSLKWNSFDSIRINSMLKVDS